MSVIIERKDSDLILVNDKHVRMHHTGVWYAPHDELTPAEKKALAEHLKI